MAGSGLDPTVRRLLGQRPTLGADQKAPNHLYHYTSQEALLGILSLRELWCSKIQYANDRTELLHAIELLRAICRRKIQAESDEANQHWLESAMSASEQIEQVNLFFFSLSEQPDLLSQWRGYCRPGNGFAIGFGGDKLADIAALAGWALAPCVYEEKRQEEILNAIIEAGLEKFTREKGDVDQRRSESAREAAIQALAVAPVFKNVAFSEEREWRLVSPLLEVGSEGFDFRTGPSSLVPFFRLRLSEDAFERLRIVVGPTPDPDLSRSATSSVLAQHGVQFESVSNSRIPLRFW